MLLDYIYRFCYLLYVKTFSTLKCSSKFFSVGLRSLGISLFMDRDACIGKAAFILINLEGRTYTENCCYYP